MRQSICQYIEAHTAAIIETAQAFLMIPELGYREDKTSAFVYERLLMLCPEGSVRKNVGETGVVATIALSPPPPGHSGINLAMLCELDAVISPEHPHADSVSGAAHSCGHHMQMAVMLAVLEALLQPGVREQLYGTLTFMAVPAEEYVEFSFRRQLVAQGRISHLSGKQEFIALGEFDSVDLALMVHAHPNSAPGSFYLCGSSLGFLAKSVEFVGKAAHAGGCPDQGVNALNAAMAAMMCIHANRETFRDADKIRIHPILTKGGDLINIVPASVVMETYVRGANLPAIQDAAQKVDRSIQGACFAIGAQCKIENIPGYLPLLQDPILSDIFGENALAALPEGVLYRGIDMVGSSDIGDVSHLLPTIQPTIGGFIGEAHTPDFRESDLPAVYQNTTKAVALSIADLLCENAKKARQVKAQFVPALSKERYLTLLRESAGPAPQKGD